MSFSELRSLNSWDTLEGELGLCSSPKLEFLLWKTRFSYSKMWFRRKSAGTLFRYWGVYQTRFRHVSADFSIKESMEQVIFLGAIIPLIHEKSTRSHWFSHFSPEIHRSKGAPVHTARQLADLLRGWHLSKGGAETRARDMNGDDVFSGYEWWFNGYLMGISWEIFHQQSDRFLCVWKWSIPPKNVDFS